MRHDNNDAAIRFEEPRCRGKLGGLIRRVFQGTDEEREPETADIHWIGRCCIADLERDFGIYAKVHRVRLRARDHFRGQIESNAKLHVTGKID